MRPRGDIKHQESYAAGANLTEEQCEWSSHWPFLQKLQRREVTLDRMYAAIIPFGRKHKISGSHLPRKELLILTMLPMWSKNSTRYHKSDRPVRLQANVSKLGRDDTGKPTIGGESRILLDVDVSKHPTQDHPILRVVNYDPTRGEQVVERKPNTVGGAISDHLVAEATGASCDETVPIVSPLEGVFRTLHTGEFTSLMVGQFPVFRFTNKDWEKVLSSIDEGTVVKEGDVLAQLPKDRRLLYRRTIFKEGVPGIDEYRVTSPVRGDFVVVRDELYVNLVVNEGRWSTLVARFLEDDVASGRVELTPEREVEGTGLVPPCEKIVPFRLEPWADEEDKYVLARLVDSVDYGLAQFWTTSDGGLGKPSWDRIGKSSDLIPVREETKMAFRAVNAILGQAARIAEDPDDVSGEPWPKTMAVFSGHDLNNLGFQSKFKWNEPLQEAMREALSPKGMFSLRFPKEGQWVQADVDSHSSPSSLRVFFQRVDEFEEDLLLVPVPMCAEICPWVEASAEDGQPITKDQEIAVWLPREYYQWEDIVEMTGSNLGLITNEFFKWIAEPWEGRFLIPDYLVTSVTSPGQDIVLVRDSDEVPENGIVLLQPRHRANYREFVFASKGVRYDLTPEHYVVAEPPKPRLQKPRRQAGHAA